MLATACFRFGAFFGVLLGRRLAPESQIVEVSVLLVALTVPMMAGA